MIAAGERAVLTLAVGKPIYTRMAVTLARSFRYWNADNGLRFCIATDRPGALPPDLHWAERIVLAPGELGDGFSPKLHLDKLSPAPRTLFVDADALCVAPLDVVFDAFAGRSVSVIGGAIASGEWFGDVARVCRHFGVPALPKFNGGIYYIEPGDAARAVYDTARALESQYDALGLVRLRGRPNDELLMAIAMAVHGLGGIPEDGSIMAEPLNFACGMAIDVLGGRAVLRNTPGHPRHQPGWPLAEAHPRIVHFLGYHTDRLPYTAEALRLEMLMARSWPRWAADGHALLTRRLPGRATELVKDLLRPAYHALFGPRGMADSRV